MERIHRSVVLPLAILGPITFQGHAFAHVSEQAFVLLLPTEAYILGGCLSVLATILVVSIIPGRILLNLFKPCRFLVFPRSEWPMHATSLVSLALLVIAVYIGIHGSRNPLTNLLPLLTWTGWWIAFVAICGLVGNLWPLFNPWTGLFKTIFPKERGRPLMILPDILGYWPAVVLFTIFAVILIADPAPDDPDRLAVVVISYWFVAFLGMIVFGYGMWLERCEVFSVFFRMISKVALFGSNGQLQIGFPGWKIAVQRKKSASFGVFALAMLAVGSFDGLKETFWWLAMIGVNPLEFPGRTTVFNSSVIGLIGAIVLLAAIFAAVLKLGLILAGSDKNTRPEVKLTDAYNSFALALIPIALGYHISHFLISLLVDGQYLLVALTTFLSKGVDPSALQHVSITTGFLKNANGVFTIWLALVFAVVSGHVVSVMVSHRIALSLFEDDKRAILFQVPLSLFMIAYTWFGLWLLATPRGA